MKKLKLNLFVLFILCANVLTIQAQNNNNSNTTYNSFEHGKANYHDQTGTTLINIKGGTFSMGSNSGESDEKPVHTVTVGNFSLSKTEVTNAQYCKFLNAKGNQSEGGATWLDINDDDCQIEKRGGTYYPKSSYTNHPVIEVTWFGAKAYCKWAGGRLPTEAEWEYAAKGGVETHGRASYKYSGSNDIGDVAWYSSNSGSKSHPVATKKQNAFGLYDMSGNVWEWCEDKWHGNYDNAPKDGSAWLSGSSSYRVLRGGSWNYSAKYCRSAFRNSIAPSSSFSCFGFRLVLAY